MKWRITAGVSALWLLIGVVLGSQAALGMTMQGNPAALAASVQTSLVNTLPWIPATLIVIAAVVRFPVRRDTWRRNLWIHLALLPAIALLANLLVVFGFWMIAGIYNGVVALLGQAAFWGTLRMHVAATVYLATAVLTQGWIRLRDARERELRVARLEGQLAQARFSALNAQMRPHFLFNTLHAIGQLWRSGRADDADAMLDHLGSLFQTVRSSTERTEIPLDEELAMVREYLAIEQARFPDRLRAQVTAEGAVGECLVPPLLLQPLVENAIRHGVSASPDAGCVSVTARLAGDTLVLEVRDDGPGMGHDTPSPGSGTGLTNTRERLEHAFGAGHALVITTPEGGGTLVRVELPAHTAEPEVAAP